MAELQALNARLVDGDVGQTLFKLSLPMIAGIFALMSYNAVDTFFVAQLGVPELAAMSFTFPVVMMVSSIAIGLGAAASSCVARAIGRGDKQRAKRLISDCLLVATAVSLLVTVVGLWFLEPLFSRLGAGPELLPLISDYMVLWLWGTFAMVVPMVATSIMRAMGDASLVGKLMIAGALANIALDPILIFGLLGAPRLELQGAAWATLLSRAIGVAIALYYFIDNKLLVNPLAELAPLRSSLREITHIGIPAMATNMIIPFASGLVLIMIAEYGDAAVAGLGIAVRIEPLALIAFYALSAVIGGFCGQNLGAGAYARLQQSLRWSLRYALSIGALLAMLLYIGAPWLVAAFTSEPASAAVAVSYLRIVPLSYGCYGLVMAANASFNGLGRPLPATVISVARVIGFYLPVAWLLQQQFGIDGLFYASATANIAVGLLAYGWLRHYYRNLAASAE